MSVLTKSATISAVGIAALVTVLAVPAWATVTDYSFDIDSGDVEVNDFSGSEVATIPISDTSGTSCGNNSVIAFDDGDNSVEATINSQFELLDVDGNPSEDYYVTLSGTAAGTYSGTSGYTVSGTLDVSANLQPLSSSCTPGAGDTCEIEAAGGGAVDITGVGTGNPASLQTTNTLTINGSNDAFELAVTGDGCGTFIAANNGSVELVDVVLTNFTPV